MSDGIKAQLLSAAQKHPEYNEEIVVAEMQQLEAMDVLDHLFVLCKKCQTENGYFDDNQLNSWLAYFVGISDKKPITQFKLDKRRTYARPGFPDIDMDFDYLRRHEIVEYFIKKYGRDCVGNIGTVQTLKTKAAVRRAIKILDPTNTVRYDENGKIVKTEFNANFQLENEILDCLPNLMKRDDGTEIKTVDEACKEFDRFNMFMQKYPEVRRVASAMENMISGYGCHAAGLILSPEPLERLCPLHVTTDKGSGLEDDNTKVIATQFTMSDVERLGLIKMDVLGLSTISAVSLATELIKENTGIEIDWYQIPLTDQKTLDLLTKGKTDGVFQAENYGMKQTFQEIGVDSFEDIVVSISMYRPGPKQYISEYANRKKGEVKVRYAHPKIKTITETTFGIWPYQEQVMRVFVELPGLTESDGYMFIKGCAKKKPEIIESFKTKFLSGCKANGVDAQISSSIWPDLQKYSGYAFNRSHAVSYAYLCYQTAYLKAHYPTEFISARLSVETIRRKFDEVAKYGRDATRNFGFKILPPNINESKTHWKIIGDKTLLMPLVCKGLGVKAAEEIIRNQPYHGSDLFETFVKKSSKQITSKTVEAMCDAGLWKMTKEDAVKRLKTLRNCIKKSKGKPLFDMFG